MSKVTMLPTFLTGFRLTLIPFFWWAAYAGCWKTFFMLFVLAAVSDIFDGYIARRYNCVTAFGSAFDPFVDKVLAISVYAIMVSYPFLFWVPRWFFVFMITKELLLIFGALYFGVLKKKITVSAAWPGKLAGVIQAIFIGAWLGGLAFWRELVAFVGLGAGMRVLGIGAYAFRTLLLATVGANLFAFLYYLYAFFSGRKLKH